MSVPVFFINVDDLRMTNRKNFLSEVRKRLLQKIQTAFCGGNHG